MERTSRGKKEHIQKIQPLAVEASKLWRKNNPELEKIRIEKLHQKSSERRETHKEEFNNNLKQAQQKAKEWRENNPEQFEEARKKATMAASKPVICLTTGKTFPSASEAGRVYNIASTTISACCRGVRKSAGKGKNGERLVWKYILKNQ